MVSLMPRLLTSVNVAVLELKQKLLVYGLIGDKGLVKGGFAGAFLHFRDGNPFTMHEEKSYLSWK